MVRKTFGCAFGASDAFADILGDYALGNACSFGTSSGAVRLRCNGVNGSGLAAVATRIIIAGSRLSLLFGTSGLLSFLAGLSTISGGAALRTLGGLTDRCSKLVVNFRLGGWVVYRCTGKGVLVSLMC